MTRIVMWVITRTRSRETTTSFLYREREPYISAKEPCTYVTSLKSPTYPLKSPLYPQKSLKCLQKRSIYPQKSPIYPQKSPVHLLHQVKKVLAMLLCKILLTSLQHIPYITATYSLITATYSLDPCNVLLTYVYTCI